LESRRIDNVILMGVHLNMCVSGRPFGLRQMAKNGKHVVLMRDMTDTMYNPARWPFVSHARHGAFCAACRKTDLPHDHLRSTHRRPAICLQRHATAGKKRLQIILLGDSTTEAKHSEEAGSRRAAVRGHAAHQAGHRGGSAACDVYNEGVSGEYIRRLLDTRYDKAVKTKPQADYIFIRYGINDMAKRERLQNATSQGLP
jgi:hypothetical protein